MNQQSIRIFMAVVAERSISGAARKLHFSQPTVSEYLGQLEKELGARLVQRERGSRQVHLTTAGEEFIPLAKRWLELDKQMEQYKQARKQRVFRLAASATAHEYVISNIVHKLMQRNPGLEIRLITVEGAALADAIENNVFDAAFYYGAKKNLARVEHIELYREERYLLCPADTVLPDRLIDPRELDPRFEVIHGMLTGNKSVMKWRDGYFPDYAGVFLHKANLMAIHNYLRDPRSWALMPVSAAQLKVAENAGRIVTRRLSDPPPGRSCWAEVSRAYTDTEGIRSFLECCDEYIDERPYLEKVLVLP
jgi:molybdate transport repressor ModE-like protein